MSETTTEPEVTPAPQSTPTSPPSPESEAPGTEATEQTPEEQRAARDEEGRRVAQLRARLGAAEREREALRAETEFYRRQMQQQAPQQETPEQQYARERMQIRAEVETQIRTETFHNQGSAAYGDWRQRCDDLVAMGADANFAQLLVEMPDGVKVTAALAGDPTEVQRIANLRTERARAVALGKYAATLEDDNGGRHARAPAPVTRAPAPIRPVTGRASPTFNEYTADGNTLVDRYMRQDLERRMRR